jgi:cytochrome c-type biogenesis protein CcmF
LFALLAALGVLCYALVAKDFEFEYVAHYTSQALPWQYRLSALWVGQAGSLLLWAFVSALLSVVFCATRADGPLRTTAFGMLMANVAFLLAVMVFAADPMKASLTVPREGLGLSPLLQHPSMLIHPPVVFLAYAAWAVPFALAAAALITGKLDEQWVRQARPWALFAWVVLGAGLLLGAHWAYQELGWGGYWGWDPVENGSLIPWLTGTALIHSLMTWRHRGSLKKLAVSLAIVTFGLCNFATFLTRSGIFSSVHAFSQSPIGWMFLGLMGVLLLGGAGLVFHRRRELAPERPLGHMFARESLVLLSAYLLLLLTTVVMVGTLCIPLSTLFLGRTAQIGPEFYNIVLMPISIALLTATAVVPLVRWGAAPEKTQRQMLLFGVGLACLLAGLAAWCGLRHPVSLAMTGLATLAVAATSGSWILDARQTRRGSGGIRGMPRRQVGLVLRFVHVLVQRRQQYAAYVIHLALVCLAIGITGSSLGSQRHEAELQEGDVFEFAGRRVECVRLIQREVPDKLIAEVELRVSRAGGSPVTLRPARHLHLLQNEWTTEVDIHSTWAGDFYTILNAGLGEGRVSLTFVDNPLMRWLWCGGWLAGGGAFVAAWPVRRRRAKRTVSEITRVCSHDRKAA